jgi:ribonuclease R
MSKAKKTAKSNKKSKKTLGKKELRVLITQYLSQQPGEYIHYKQLFRALKLTNGPLKMLAVDILNEMIEAGEVTHNEEGDVSYNGHSQICEGVFTRTAGGKNFVDLPDGIGVSVYDEDTLHALPGDKVKVSLFAKKKNSQKLQGQVVEIVKRNDKPYIGVLQISKHAAFLVSTNGQLPHDILIPLDKLKGGKNGEKALVKITDWPDHAHNPVGAVVDVLGASGENDTEMHAILAEFGLPYKYPEKVERAADTIDPGITDDEVAKRIDMRDVTTFTIDPRDAKDFDDALSIRKLKEGLWEVGVHIADVSHYVLEGSVIDKEAQQRGTSVYLVDRTIPMLPERLCNFICSLRPDEDKLTFSVIFTMNDDAEVLSSKIAHTVTRSNRRFTYEEVQHLFETIGDASEEDLQYPTPEQPLAEGACPAETYREELVTLNHMAKILRKQRFRNGAVDFDREEVRFEIDDKGKPLSVYFKRAKDANKLVEEFMLLANRTVAESVGKNLKKGEKAKTLPYRVHDVPDPNKLESLGKFIARFGLQLRTQGSRQEVAKSLTAMLHESKGKPMEELVEMMSLRAMMKARYSTVNIGHYGLAFDYYTHFTSPIRRYPDLMVHRLLTRYENGSASASQKKYEGLCDHASDMEQLAASAERASIKYKQVEFLADKIGEEFEAKISGVTEFGLYAEIIENRCEGLIPVRYLGEEAFDFDDRNYALVGRRTHHKFCLGDKIQIRVVRANLMQKQLDFEFVKKIEAAPGTTAPKTPFYEVVEKKKKRKKN